MKKTRRQVIEGVQVRALRAQRGANIARRGRKAKIRKSSKTIGEAHLVQVPLGHIIYTSVAQNPFYTRVSSSLLTLFHLRCTLLPVY